MKVWAETGVMWPPAKGLLEPPKAGRGRVGFSPGAFRGSVALLMPRFQTVASRAVKECISF